MADATSPMLGVPGVNSGFGSGFLISGQHTPGSFVDAVSPYSTPTNAVRPTLADAPRVYDGTSVGLEEAFVSPYASRVRQPGNKIVQSAKPLTYLAKTSTKTGLANQWYEGMPMFAIKPVDTSRNEVTRIGVIQPQHRAVTTLSGAQLNKLLLEHHHAATLEEGLGIHEDARMPNADPNVEHSKWANTVAGIGKYISYVGILMTAHGTSGTGTYVNVSRMGRILMPN